MQRIGIPNSLYTYYHLPIFKTFFEYLDTEVVLSGKTNRKILENGIKSAPQEICLPVKAYLGHILEIRDSVDFLFIPRIATIKTGEKNSFAYGCPKMIGLVDTIRALFYPPQADFPPILEFVWNEKERDLSDSLFELGRILTNNKKRIKEATKLALSVIHLHQPLSEAQRMKYGIRDTEIGVVGHPYLLKDSHLSLGLLDKIKGLGVNLITPDEVPHQFIKETRHKFSFINWFYEQEILASIDYLINIKRVAGLIIVSSFVCGTEAVVNEVFRYEMQDRKVPFLILLFDEHSSETGIMTRLESFIDLVNYKMRKAER